MNTHLHRYTHCGMKKQTKWVASFSPCWVFCCFISLPSVAMATALSPFSISQLTSTAIDVNETLPGTSASGRSCWEELCSAWLLEQNASSCSSFSKSPQGNTLISHKDKLVHFHQNEQSSYIILWLLHLLFHCMCSLSLYVVQHHGTVEEQQAHNVEQNMIFDIQLICRSVQPC